MLLISVLSSLHACSGSPRGGPGGDAGLALAPDAATPPDAAAPPRPDAGPNTVGDVVVWAHSRDELYRFDPRTNEVQSVGVFRLPGGEVPEQITDLAVDGVGNVFLCSFQRLFRVDTTNAQVMPIGEFGIAPEIRFNALTYVPPGTLDPASEVLVAATAEGAFYRISLGTGAATEIGRFAPGYGSSGDIVSVAGAGTFATVTKEGVDTDFLVRLDPMTGAITEIGSTGTARLFGLGYWRNRLYGFNSIGLLWELDIMTGRGQRVPGVTGARSFNGAGVTTNAPTAPF